MTVPMLRAPRNARGACNLKENDDDEYTNELEIANLAVH